MSTTNPNIGEYWYIKGFVRYYDDYGDNYLTTPEVILSKICSVNEYEIVIINKFGTSIANRNTVVGKWEPNWFWKLLGYK